MDLDIGVKSFTISNTISGWRAELEVWENGYVRAFRSYEDWNMVVKVIGMKVPVKSEPSNEFVYVWNDDEIASLLAQDKRLEVTLRNAKQHRIRSITASIITQISLKTEANSCLTSSRLQSLS